MGCLSFWCNIYKANIGRTGKNTGKLYIKCTHPKKYGEYLLY